VLRCSYHLPFLALRAFCLWVDLLVGRGCGRDGRALSMCHPASQISADASADPKPAATSIAVANLMRLTLRRLSFGVLVLGVRRGLAMRTKQDWFRRSCKRRYLSRNDQEEAIAALPTPQTPRAHPMALALSLAALHTLSTDLGLLALAVRVGGQRACAFRKARRRLRDLGVRHTSLRNAACGTDTPAAHPKPRGWRIRWRGRTRVIWRD
jgi:hypothetical protein